MSDIKKDLHISDEMFERHLQLYDRLTKAIRKELAEFLTEEEKSDLLMAYVTILTVLRVAANMTLSIGGNYDRFISGCVHIFSFEEIMYAEKNKTKKPEQKKSDLN